MQGKGEVGADDLNHPRKRPSGGQASSTTRLFDATSISFAGSKAGPLRRTRGLNREQRTEGARGHRAGPSSVESRDRERLAPRGDLGPMRRLPGHASLTSGASSAARVARTFVLGSRPLSNRSPRFPPGPPLARSPSGPRPRRRLRTPRTSDGSRDTSWHPAEQRREDRRHRDQEPSTNRVPALAPEA